MTVDDKVQEGVPQPSIISDVPSELSEPLPDNETENPEITTSEHISACDNTETAERVSTDSENFQDISETASSSKAGTSPATKKLRKKEQEALDKERVQAAIRVASGEELEQLWIPIIMENQTADEQINGNATEANGIGLNRYDAEFMTDIYEQIQNGNSLSGNQVDAVKKKLKKYWKQFLDKIPSNIIGSAPSTSTGISNQGASIINISPPTFGKQSLSLDDIASQLMEGKILRHCTSNSKETSLYEFIIENQRFALPLDQLCASPSRFAVLYTEAHKVFPFKHNRPSLNEWIEFVEWVMKIAEDAGFEETNDVIGAKCFIDHIQSNFTTTEDLKIFLNTNTCGDRIGKFTQQAGPNAGEDFLMLPSTLVTRILDEEIPVRISAAALANALRALGYMDGKTRGKKIDGENVNCWWFYPDKFNIRSPNPKNGSMVEL